MLIYFYTVFVLLFSTLYLFTFLIICFQKLNKVRLDSCWNNLVPLIFLLIIIAASAWLTYLFESRLAAQIQETFNYLVDRAIRYLSNNLYLSIVKNGINTLVKWIGTIGEIFSTIIQLWIINIPALRIGILVRNVDGNEKLIRNSYIGNDIRANS